MVPGIFTASSCWFPRFSPEKLAGTGSARVFSRTPESSIKLFSLPRATKGTGRNGGERVREDRRMQVHSLSRQTASLRRGPPSTAAAETQRCDWLFTERLIASSRLLILYFSLSLSFSFSLLPRELYYGVGKGDEEKRRLERTRGRYSITSSV